MGHNVYFFSGGPKTVASIVENNPHSRYTVKPWKPNLDTWHIKTEDQSQNNASPITVVTSLQNRYSVNKPFVNTTPVESAPQNRITGKQDHNNQETTTPVTQETNANKGLAQGYNI